MYSWGNKGTKQPFKNILFTRSISIMSTISTTGKVFNVIKEGTIRSNDFIEYIRQMVKYMKSNMNIENREIELILDNWAVHSVKATIQALKEIGICIYFIPPYCPELAPIENYFSILKQEVLSKWEATQINLNSSEGKEFIMKWSESLQESIIRSLWDNHLDEIKNIIQSNKNLI